MSSFYEELTEQRLGPPTAEEIQEVDPVEQVGQSDGSDATPHLETPPGPGPQPVPDADPEPGIGLNPAPSRLESSIEVEVELDPESDAEPESKPERHREPAAARPRAHGSPIPDVLKPTTAKEPEPAALKGYVPPILEF